MIIIKVVSTARQYTEPAVQRVSTANQISQRSTWYQISGDKTNSLLVRVINDCDKGEGITFFYSSVSSGAPHRAVRGLALGVGFMVRARW